MLAQVTRAPLMQTDISLGFVMDPISNINVKKDSTFAMMLEAQRRS